MTVTVPGFLGAISERPAPAPRTSSGVRSDLQLAREEKRPLLVILLLALGLLLISGAMTTLSQWFAQFLPEGIG